MSCKSCGTLLKSSSSIHFVITSKPANGKKSSPKMHAKGIDKNRFQEIVLFVKMSQKVLIRKGKVSK